MCISLSTVACCTNCSVTDWRPISVSTRTVVARVDHPSSGHCCRSWEVAFIHGSPKAFLLSWDGQCALIPSGLTLHPPVPQLAVTLSVKM